MVELRVVVSDELAEELARRAREQHTTAEELVSRAAEPRYQPAAPRAHASDPKGFIGMFASGESDTSQRIEEILRGVSGS